VSEYRHTIYKQQLNEGYATSPPQNIGNASTLGFNEPITLKNGVSTAVAIGYGKRAITTVANATVNQLGSDQLQDSINIAKRLGGYIGIGIVAPQLLPLALTVDAVNFAVDKTIELQGIAFENERIIRTRGQRRTSIGGYYG
jgi:hypothetical protein